MRNIVDLNAVHRKYDLFYIKIMRTMGLFFLRPYSAHGNDTVVLNMNCNWKDAKKSIRICFRLLSWRHMDIQCDLMFNSVMIMTRWKLEREKEMEKARTNKKKG